MLAAIVATVATLVAIVAVVLVLLYLRNRRKSDNLSVKRDVSSISSVGVSSSLGEGGAHAGGSSSQRVEKRMTNANPSDAVESRFAAMGVFAAAIFGTLGAKLFSMQVVQTESYARQADENTYSTVYTPAPRGIIYDTDGVALVQNRSSLTVLADGDVADDHDVVQRLSTVLGLPYNVVRSRIQDTSSGAQSQRVVASDVRLRDVAFISEHSDAFPNVTVQNRTVREYPYGALAAHVLGYTGTISEEELEETTEGRDLESGDEVGKTGIEEYYDGLLSGDHGVRQVVSDADGDVVEVVSETDPTRGSDLTLTIAAPVQYVCDEVLADLVAPTGTIGSGSGVGAAVVVMDVTDGSILAMASYPTYDPGKFIGGISQETWDLYSDEDAHTPLLNRAIAGTYPAASTFKAFTGLSALEYDIASEDSYFTCTGSWDGWDTGEPQNCWNHNGHGTLSFREGIVQSCDVVFYEIAKDFWNRGETQGGDLSDTAMQDYVLQFGFGETTGIDLSGEEEGRVPTPEWKEEYYANQPEAAQWQGGDMTNLVIGQGYVLTTPIELAVAYGAIATGNIMQPHLLKEVKNADGEVVQTVEASVKSTPEVASEDYETIRDALRGVATENSSIYPLFDEYGVEAACKTGTAEYTDEEDTAWFACYGPYDDPKYVVTVVVEHGGGGSDVAAPVGAEVLAAAISYGEGELTEIEAVSGSSGQSTEDAGSSTGSSRTD